MKTEATWPILNTSTSFHKKNWLTCSDVRLKIAGTDQVSFGSVLELMVVKIIWSTDRCLV